MRIYAYFLTGVLLLAANYQNEIQTWRAEREQRLKSDTGWLTVAGLFWLKEGRNSFGSAQANDIVLPAGPARAGWLELNHGRITVHLPDQPPRKFEPDREAQGDT